MDDMVFLCSVKRRRNLEDDFHGAVGGETPRERKRLPEVPARNAVHHDVVEPSRLVIAAVVDGDEVWMAYARRDLRLAQEPLHVVFVFLRHLREESLEGVDRVEHFVPDEIHGAKRAVAEKTLHHIAAELVPAVEDLLLAEIHLAPPIFTTTAE